MYSLSYELQYDYIGLRSLYLTTVMASKMGRGQLMDSQSATIAEYTYIAELSNK